VDQTLEKYQSTQAFYIYGPQDSNLWPQVKIVSRGLKKVTRGLKIVSRGLKIVTCGLNIVTRGLKIVSRLPYNVM